MKWPGFTWSVAIATLAVAHRGRAAPSSAPAVDDPAAAAAPPPAPRAPGRAYQLGWGIDLPVIAIGTVMMTARGMRDQASGPPEGSIYKREIHYVDWDTVKQLSQQLMALQKQAPHPPFCGASRGHAITLYPHFIIGKRCHDGANPAGHFAIAKKCPGSCTVTRNEVAQTSTMKCR